MGTVKAMVPFILSGCLFLTLSLQAQIEGSSQSELFVPIILSGSGLNNSFFTSELTLTNHGSQDAQLVFSYTAAFGEGSGTVRDSLSAGLQKVIPDAIGYLRSLGLRIPQDGSQGGTLLVSFLNVSSPGDGQVTVRTTTTTPTGRAGLSYAGVPQANLLTRTAYLCGLRQNNSDRSNVAIQHAGDSGSGEIVL